jgi:hypothetical protein
VHSFPRKSTPKVRDGKVQRKNRAALSLGYKNYVQNRPQLERERPGAGYRHVLRKGDVERFITLLPDWDELSRDLDAIVLAAGDPDSMGWYGQGVVAVCAWDRELSRDWRSDFVVEHAPILERLDVSIEAPRRGMQRVHITEESVRAFQLMHVLLHELGHHHDRMTTRSQRRASRGEGFAEEYANRYMEAIWQAYTREFAW